MRYQHNAGCWGRLAAAALGFPEEDVKLLEGLANEVRAQMGRIRSVMVIEDEPDRKRPERRVRRGGKTTRRLAAALSLHRACLRLRPAGYWMPASGNGDGPHLRRLAEGDAALMEEHLLVCEECRARLNDWDRYVRAMRAALGEFSAAPLRQSDQK